MGALLAYSIESSLLLAVMYLAYKWVLSTECQHSFNRIVLWGIYALAMLLPLRGALPAIMPTDGAAPTVMIEAETLGAMMVIHDEPEYVSLQSVVMQVLLWIYLAGILAVAAHTAVVAVRLAMLVRRGERVTVDDREVVLIDNDGIAPFSVMRVIVMSRRDFDEAGAMIFEHERNHVRLNHWVDLLMAQAVALVQWYNPAAWLMREELRAIHEYQADAGVMRSGLNIKQYQMLLIKKAVGARFPSLANSLNHSKLKKRITMMYNSRTSRTRRLRALVLVPALGGALFVTNIPAVAGVFDSAEDAVMINSDKVSENVIDTQVVPESAASVMEEVESHDAVTTKESVAVSQSESESEPASAVVAKDEKNTEDVTTSGGELSDIVVVGYGTVKKEQPKKSEEVRGKDSAQTDKVFSVVEEAPKYPGGQNELLKFIAQNIRYPQDAQRDSVQGRVVLQFVVGKDGKVRSPKIIRGVYASLDEEAKRVVMMLPDFIPGKMNGEPVAVEYTLPIMFKLSGADKDRSVSKIAPVNLNNAIKNGTTVIIDGKKVESLDGVVPENVKSIHVIQDDPKYPKGLVKITMKDGSNRTVER